MWAMYVQNAKAGTGSGVSLPVASMAMPGTVNEPTCRPGKATSKKSHPSSTAPTEPARGPRRPSARITSAQSTKKARA